MLCIMMNQSKSASTPAFLHEHAEDNLRFIRTTMESATTYTGVSGLGYVIAGSTAFLASWLASQQANEASWLAIWMLELVVAGVIAFGLSAFKGVKQGTSFLSPSGRKLLFVFIPTMLAGGLITVSFLLQGHVSLLPGIWLSIYGAAVMTAGLRSVAILPVMGALFLLLGAITLLAPVSGDVMLALGMGGLHLVFGIIIWRYHGG